MKQLMAVLAIIIAFTASSTAQDGKVVAITKLKTIFPENGTARQRDSLIAIYANKVIKNNPLILSHMEMSHWFTSDSKDYMIIETYNKFDDIAKANEMNTELEKKAWPDEKERKAFGDAMAKYFENWHGDMLMREVAGATK